MSSKSVTYPPAPAWEPAVPSRKTPAHLPTNAVCVIRSGTGCFAFNWYWLPDGTFKTDVSDPTRPGIVPSKHDDGLYAAATEHGLPIRGRDIASDDTQWFWTDEQCIKEGFPHNVELVEGKDVFATAPDSEMWAGHFHLVRRWESARADGVPVRGWILEKTALSVQASPQAVTPELAVGDWAYVPGQAVAVPVTDPLQANILARTGYVRLVTTQIPGRLRDWVRHILNTPGYSKDLQRAAKYIDSLIKEQ